MRGKSFSLDPMEEEQAAYQATMTNTETWHKRLGHFHHTTILNMQKELVRGLPHIEFNLPSYKACHFGKQAKLPFQKGAQRANMNLQLIHIDIVGPHKTPSLNGVNITLF